MDTTRQLVVTCRESDTTGNTNTAADFRLQLKEKIELPANCEIALLHASINENPLIEIPQGRMSVGYQYIDAGGDPAGDDNFLIDINARTDTYETASGYLQEALNKETDDPGVDNPINWVVAYNRYKGFRFSYQTGRPTAVVSLTFDTIALANALGFSTNSYTFAEGPIGTFESEQLPTRIKGTGFIRMLDMPIQTYNTSAESNNPIIGVFTESNDGFDTKYRFEYSPFIKYRLNNPAPISVYQLHFSVTDADNVPIGSLVTPTTLVLSYGSRKTGGD